MPGVSLNVEVLVPRRTLPNVLLAVCALLVLTLAVAPAIDARPKGKRNETTTENRRPDRESRREERAGRADRGDRKQRRDRPRRERNRVDDAVAAELSAPWLPPPGAPYFNHELIAAAAAAGEIYDPAPPPVPTRAWDDDAAAVITWQSIVRVDAGVTPDAKKVVTKPAATGPENDVSESRFTHGWAWGGLALQEEIARDEPPGDDAGEQQAGSDASGGDAPAPVPVESGLIITDTPPAADPARETPEVPTAEIEPLDAPVATPDAETGDKRQQANKQRTRREKRRGRAGRDVAMTADTASDAERARKRANRRAARSRNNQGAWSGDRFFSGGIARVWDADLEIAGTDNVALYVTQRTGTGAGERRGFSYAIPVDGSGDYLVRLYFAEPYWGTSDAPGEGEGRRVFSVTGEKQTLLEDLDIYAEAGPLTALVKEVEVEVSDGELNLDFVATSGEPMVAAIEVLAAS